MCTVIALVCTLTITDKTDTMKMNQRHFLYMKNHKERDRLKAILYDLKDKSGCRNAAELAQRIGIPGQRLRSYMRGQNTAQGESLRKIEEFMGLPEGELLTRLYGQEDVVYSAEELFPMFCSLEVPEKKLFLRMVMEVV